jgi:Na+/proline symporter/nitrogen-specific signal transduction histidine kinase
VLQLGQLFAVAVGYLLLLFLVAYAAERRWVPAKLVRHPLTYALSLGVYATSWSYSGSVGYARTQGFNFLAIYVGVTLSCLLVPVVWQPVLRLTREHQLTSLADLFAFRFQSHSAGVLVTLFMLAGNLPYLALQIRAVTQAVRLLGHAPPASLVGLVFCALVALFALLFGARHVSPRERHAGLGLAIAFESVVKLVALLAVAAVAVTQVFGGAGGLQRWLSVNPEALEAAFRPMREGPWATLLLLSFAAGFLLPRQFHMAFTEALGSNALRVAAWAFPAFLLLLNLAVLPLLWAGQVALPGVHPDNYVLGLARGSGVSALAFVGAVSAASAMVIVDTLALAAMCLNHLLLPRSDLAGAGDLYRGLLWARRVLIVVIIFVGYGFSRVLDVRAGLVELGLISFVAVVQVLPGVLAVLFWRGATRVGFLTGLSAGIAVWGATLFLPLLARAHLLPASFDLAHLFGILPGAEPWSISTFWSLGLNVVLFAGVSLVTKASAREEEAAGLCTRAPKLADPVVVEAHSPRDFQAKLAPLLGQDAATTEVDQALADLNMVVDERRPAQLQRLRERLQRNLSGLVGPLRARWLVDRGIRVDPRRQPALSERLRFLEEQLRVSRAQLHGAPAELEAFRRYLRRVLEDLPLGVCALGPDRDVVIWNHTLATLSGVPSQDAVGARLEQLPGPFPEALRAFLEQASPHAEVCLTLKGRERVLALGKSQESTGTAPADLKGPVLLVEDLTERKALAAQVAHQDRLASVGRLAAGVAHEIGNPLTGIACLAQNLAREATSAEQRERFALILRETQRIDTIVRVLLGFSHAGTIHAVAEPERFEAREAVGEAITLVQLSRQAKHITCLNRVPTGLLLDGDRQRLLQVFVNLVSNACDASPTGGEVSVEAEVIGDVVRFRVVDHGTGIDDAVRERMFEPFFTTKPPGQGTGLGLPLAHSIIREHLGSIDVETSPGKGTTVVVELPSTGEAELGADVVRAPAGR